MKCAACRYSGNKRWIPLYGAIHNISPLIVGGIAMTIAYEDYKGERAPTPEARTVELWACPECGTVRVADKSSTSRGHVDD